jgi:carbon storage regulator
MLVLSRKRDEVIMIGDDVEITIVDVKGDTVKIGVTAPKQIAVYRKEVYEAIERENVEASRSPGARKDLAQIARALRNRKSNGEPEDNPGDQKKKSDNQK